MTRPPRRRPTGPRRAQPASRAAWWSVAALGVGLLVAGIVLALTRSGDPAAHAIPLPDKGELPTSSAAPSTHPRGARRPPDGDRTAADSTARRGNGPIGHVVEHGTLVPHARLTLRHLRIDAPVRRVNAVHGVMRVPLDPTTLGWWTGGAAPGDANGTVVVVGHINYDGVTGALSSLPEVDPGDVVTVSGRHGADRYRVAAVRSYPKTSGIPAAVFTRSGPARLALITCGGDFDASTGNYLDNIVAYAYPLK